FSQSDVACGFSKIMLGSLLDSVGAGTKIDTIDVELENLRLGEFPLEPERQHHLLKLAGDRPFLGQEKIFGKLLRDCGAALCHAAVQDVGEGRTSDSEGIDTAMRVEAPVLYRDERLRHVDRHFLQSHGIRREIAA